MVTALLVVLGLLALLGVAVWVASWRVREADRVTREEQLAAWRMRQVVMEARRQMHEAARQHLP